MLRIRFMDCDNIRYSRYESTIDRSESACGLRSVDGRTERHAGRSASGLSQPAMSNALTRLRRTFDDPLLVRTPGAMTPTPRAQALDRSRSRCALTLRVALEKKPAFDPAASRRGFHVLASDYAEIVLLAPLVGKLREQARRRQHSRASASKCFSTAVTNRAVGFV